MHFTWTASCDAYGTLRGHNICSNMNVVIEEVTAKPCVTKRVFSMHGEPIFGRTFRCTKQEFTTCTMRDMLYTIYIHTMYVCNGLSSKLNISRYLARLFS